MQTKINQQSGTCQIWIPYQDKSTYKTSSEFSEVMSRCKKLQLKPYVYIGGQQPLLPTISALLDEQNPSQFLG